MRNMLAFLAAAVLVFLGLGWYLDWYSFKSLPGSAGRESFNVDINKDKITRDVQKGVQKGEEKLHETMDKKKAEAPEETGNRSTQQARFGDDMDTLIRMMTPQLFPVIINAEEELSILKGTYQF